MAEAMTSPVGEKDSSKELTPVQNLDRYLKALDLTFGLNQDLLNDPSPQGYAERAKVYKEGNEAGEAMFKNFPGEEVFVSPEIVKQLQDKLGFEETRRLLGLYKNGLDDKFRQTGKHYGDQPGLATGMNALNKLLDVPTAKRIVFK